MSEGVDVIPDILHHLYNSIILVEERTAEISSANDFTEIPEGIKLLDSISMRLQFIGESVKKIEKIDQSFLSRYPEIEWTKIINFRNFISHHYEMLNHEIVYNICTEKIPQLKIAVEKMIKENDSSLSA